MTRTETQQIYKEDEVNYLWQSCFFDIKKENPLKHECHCFNDEQFLKVT